MTRLLQQAGRRTQHLQHRLARRRIAFVISAQDEHVLKFSFYGPRLGQVLAQLGVAAANKIARDVLLKKTSLSRSQS